MSEANLFWEEIMPTGPDILTWPAIPLWLSWWVWFQIDAYGSMLFVEIIGGTGETMHWFLNGGPKWAFKPADPLFVTVTAVSPRGCSCHDVCNDTRLHSTVLGAIKKGKEKCCMLEHNARRLQSDTQSGFGSDLPKLWFCKDIP